MKIKNRFNQVKILDTFPDFESYWKQYKHTPRRVQVEAWESEYMGKWPALLKKQTGQYRSEGIDWKKVAEKRVFPYLETRLASMRLARKRLLEESIRIIRKAMTRFRDHHPVYVIIYVGIGLGAGWATTYQKSPALLFGLENIAEEGWTERAEIKGLITHELGHLFHSFWREEAGKRFRSDPLWQLYTEGFADRFEITLQATEMSHRDSLDRESIWFDKNKKWLALEFLKRVQNRRSFREFFGSWYEIRGHSQMGYFLGSEIVKRLENSYTLQEIASIDDVRNRVKRQLLEIGVESQ